MELIARVKAQLRRYTKYNDSKKINNIIQIDELIINCATREVNLKNKFIKLTPKEYSILECLALNKGTILTIENLYEAVWKEEFVVSDTSITVHITNLRHKLEVDPKNPQYIKTVWGVGYKI
jgi:DNA-binding response OmpR family regulator